MTDSRTSLENGNINESFTLHNTSSADLDPFSSSAICPSTSRTLRSSSIRETVNVQTKESNHRIPSFNFMNSSHSSTSPSIQCKNAKETMCIVCKKYFKGRRGLNIHLGRSSTCKQAVRPPPAQMTCTIADQSLSIPQAVREAIKSPSTVVEDLEHKCGDGKNTKIKFHNSKYGCKMCHVLSTKDHFVSTSTHRIYASEIPSSICQVDCNSSNLIYLITCRKCFLQYVGETCQKIRERFNVHNTCISHPEKDHSCRILSEHFSKGSCKGATYTVSIIEKLDGDGRDCDGNVDPSVTVIRRKKETDWMLKLRTVSPFGLNDRIGNEYMPDKGNNIICKRFPSLKRHNKHSRVRTKTTVSHNLIVDHFPYIVMDSIKTNLRNTMNLIRVLLSSLNRASYKKLGDVINDFLLDKHENFLYSHFFLAALDIISSKVWKAPPIIKQKTASKFRLNINFCNKGIDFINLPKMLKNPELVDLLPSPLKKESPMVVFDLLDPIRSKMFNYKKTVQELDVDAFLSDSSILPCSCANSSFKDEHHGHIITGDLRIVENNKLRKLLVKGPKFRESEGICWNKAKESILQGINDSIKKWADSKGLHLSLFTEWKNKLCEHVDNKISILKRRIHPRKVQRTLNDSEVKKYLTDLQQQYVMVPIDKADNNVAFICKRYYIEVIAKELGLLGSQSSTYEHISNTNPNDIVSNHRTELYSHFNMTIPEEMHTLPDIYWLPKLHKTPIKARFIIASQKCSVKKLSKDITSIFKLAYDQIERYNQKASSFSGIKTFWVIQNSLPVLNTLDKINSKNNAKTISSFDFSTLYTNIPHAKLLEELSGIIKFMFKGGTRSTISISKFGVANWTKYANNSQTKYDLDKILKAIKFLLDNCHFKFGNKLFRQVIGIPMGSDPAPYFANLFLYRFESRWLNRMKKENPVLARKFGRIFRYIDDLLAINDGNEFEKHYLEIYPSELELKKENTGYTETSFLELSISISNRSFSTKLYDKRDAFGFHISRLPFRDSNIPKRMFYSSACAEVLRICRATSCRNDAIISAKSLTARMLRQGADKYTLKAFLTRSLNKHQIPVDKFDTPTESFIKECI